MTQELPDGVTLINDNLELFIGEDNRAIVAIVEERIGVRPGLGGGDSEVFTFLTAPVLQDGLSWEWSKASRRFEIVGRPTKPSVTRYLLIVITLARGGFLSISSETNTQLFTFTVTVRERPAITATRNTLNATVGRVLSPTLVAYIGRRTQDHDYFEVVSNPPLPDGLIVSASSGSGRVVISGTPTVSGSGLYILSAQEILNSGVVKSLSGSATIAITVSVPPPSLPKPSITVLPTVTRQAGKQAAAISIASLLNVPTEDWSLNDFVIAGHRALGLALSKRVNGLQLSGFIPATVAPRAYVISVFPTAHFRDTYLARRSDPPADFRFTYTLNVSAAAATPDTPDEVAPPYWEGKPDQITLTEGVRVSPENPIPAGSIRQVDNLAVKLETDAIIARLPRNITLTRRGSDGAVFVQGTPVESGTFSVLVELSVTGADPVTEELFIRVLPAEAPEPDPEPTPVVDPDDPDPPPTPPPPPPPPRTNAPPTIRVHQRNLVLDVDEPISIKLFTIADPDDVPTSTVAGLPEGLELSVTGTLRGTIPTTARRGDYRITVTTTDGVNAAVSANATITVRGEVPRIAPPVHSNVADDFSLQQGVSGSLRRLVSVSGETSNVVTGLPPDLEWEKRAGSIVLIGRVQTEAAARAYQVAITSTNLGGQTTTIITITVTGDTPEPDEDTRGITLLEDLYTFTQGQTVNQRIFDATVDITNSGLPQGLSLTARGILTGTVTAAPGAYAVSLTNTAAEVTQVLTIIVQAQEEEPEATFAVFGDATSGFYQFSKPGIPITVRSAELTQRTVDTSLEIVRWEFGQADPPDSRSAGFTVQLNNRPRWLFPPQSNNQHNWLINPASVPVDHYNKFVSFAIRAVGTGDNVQQINVRVFIFGPVPAAIPDTRVTFLRGSTPDAAFHGPLREQRSLTLDLEPVDGAEIYAIYAKNLRVTASFNRGAGQIEIGTARTVWLEYEYETDGRLKLVGGKVTISYRLTGGSPFSDRTWTVEIAGNPIPSDYPIGADLPAVSVPPRQVTRLNRDNANTDLQANRLWLNTRNLFRLLGSELAEERDVQYIVEADQSVIPINEILVTPKPFASWKADNDFVPAHGIPPNVVDAVPARNHWIDFEAEPSIEQYGRYEVPITITRRIDATRVVGTIWQFVAEPGTEGFDSISQGTQLVRVAPEITPTPTTEGFRNAYRIEIFQEWESDPFLASNLIGDPIEITFVNAPEGFAVGEEEIDGYRFNWTPTREQAGRHEIEVHITANPGIEGYEPATLIVVLTIDVVTNKGHITQIENPSSIREFGEFFMRPPSFHNFQFLEYGLRGKHIVPPRTLLLSFPIDSQFNDKWYLLEPGSVINLNLFNVLQRPTVFVVDKVTLQDAGFGASYKRVWLTEKRTQPEGWYQGTATQSDGVFTNFATLATSNHAVELRDQGDEKFVELVPSVREVLLVTVEDDGSAQAIITGNPIPFFPPNVPIQLRIGDYVSSGPAEITPTSITWNGTTTVPTFGDTEEVIIEAAPSTEVPRIPTIEDDEEEIFELGIRFDGHIETNPGVLRGRYLVQRHVNTLVAYDEATGELWDAESGVLIGTTLAGQSAITSVKLPGRLRPSLLIRGSEDYEVEL